MSNEVRPEPPEFYEPREVANSLFAAAREAVRDYELPPALAMWIGIATGTLMRLADEGEQKSGGQ